MLLQIVLFYSLQFQYLFLHLHLKLKPYYEKGHEIVLDGEFYSHKTVLPNGETLLANKNFNFISSCCKVNLKVPNPNEKLIEYHVFDIIDESKILEDAGSVVVWPEADT
jgi:hypothetical protein